MAKSVDKTDNTIYNMNDKTDKGGDFNLMIDSGTIYKLGDRVRCDGYLKRVKMKYVLVDSDEEGCLNMARLSADGDVPYEQERYKVNECSFNGIVIGCRNVVVSKFFDYATRGDTCDWDYGDIAVENGRTIKCYVVAYQMGRKRYVPIDMLRLGETK